MWLNPQETTDLVTFTEEILNESTFASESKLNFLCSSIYKNQEHCVKSVKYGVIPGTYFPVLGLNTWKYGPEITLYLDNFHAVEIKSTASSF